MTVRIESAKKLKVGDEVEHNGKKYVVAEAVVWSDAADNYAHTEAVLKLARGGDGGHSDRDK
jgi:hypothetical protein